MSKAVNVGGVLIGGGNKISVQTMTTVKTEKIEKSLDLIAQNVDIFISKGWQAFASVMGEKNNGI